MIKALAIDFDDTLVTDDLLSVICGIVGKEKESRQLALDYFEGRRFGTDALIERINFLHGVSFEQITKKLNEKDYLMSGAEALFNFLRENKIITILNSGQLVPILEVYKQKLGINYIIGSEPKMRENVIDSISAEDFSGPDFKLDGVKKILAGLNISPSELVAVGDSPADKTIFQFASRSIAFNPRNGIEEYADAIIYNDLAQAIPIIKVWQNLPSA